MQSLLYSTQYQVGENVTLHIPTIGEIFDDERSYYKGIEMFVAMPIDFMVQLDDVGIDFSKINDWELFLLLFNALKDDNVNFGLLFDNLDLNDFTLAQADDDSWVILNRQTRVIIDEKLYRHISNAMCLIHGMKKDERRPANKEAKEFMIETERKKQKRRARRKAPTKGELETLITALVNTEQFKYNYDTVRDLTIYQFRESVKQIIHKVEFEHVMHGVYAGTLNADKMNKDDLNWLVHK